MAHVRAVRGQSAISVEFMRLSAGGYSTLAELIADLKRPRHGVIRNRRLLERSYSLAPALKLITAALSSGPLCRRNPTILPWPQVAKLGFGTAIRERSQSSPVIGPISPKAALIQRRK